jgi:hypothetical protein
MFTVNARGWFTGDRNNDQSMLPSIELLPLLPRNSGFNAANDRAKMGKRLGLVTPTQLSPAPVSTCIYETSPPGTPNLPSDLPPNNSAWER